MTPGPSHLTKTSCICYRRTTLRSAVKKKKSKTTKATCFVGGNPKDSTRGVKTTTHHMNCFKAQRIMGHQKLLRHGRLIGKKKCIYFSIVFPFVKNDKNIIFFYFIYQHHIDIIAHLFLFMFKLTK